MTNATVNPSEVGWQFVPQYYTFVNKQPNRLHCFYTKASTFIHGTEGEDGKTCYGQQVRPLPSQDASCAIQDAVLPRLRLRVHIIHILVVVTCYTQAVCAVCIFSRFFRLRSRGETFSV